MRKIGLIASDSSEGSAEVILQEGEEGRVEVETLVLVENRSSRVLGVLRTGRGFNEGLRVGAYRPGVAYAKRGGTPPASREVFSFNLAVIGKVTEAGIEPNREILAPRSVVKVFEPEDKPNPMEYLAQGKKVLWFGHYVGYEGWRIPADPNFIPYHIGVFGATGSGKSYLTRCALLGLLNDAGYRVLVLDWSGADYAPDAEVKESISNMALDEEVVVNYLAKKARYFGHKKQWDDSLIREALEDFVGEDWVNKVSKLKSAERLKLEFENHMRSRIEAIINEDKRQRGLRSRLERGLKRLTQETFQQVMGRKRPKDLLEQLKGITVLNMSEAGSDEKLSFFISLADHLLNYLQKMKPEEKLNLALVIDEAPQYAPWSPEGLQADATDRIKDLCALGRKHGLCMVLISQGIAGDIGINAAVRRNLNTFFFGSIHPLDMEEAKKWLEPYGIPVSSLLQLKPGQFYFSGKMNPSPIPLLMTFTPKGS